jgi:hypothetical protein
MLDRIVVNAFVQEGAYIARCCSNGGGAFVRMFFRTPRDQLSPIDAAPYVEEIHAINADFFVVSGDTEIQMRRIIPDIAMIFALRPSLLLAWLTASSSQDALAKLLHMYTYDRHPPCTFFRAQLDPRARKTAWSFAAIVSHAMREVEASDATVPLYYRVVLWLENNVVDWKTTIPGVILVHEIVAAVLFKRRCVGKR